MQEDKFLKIGLAMAEILNGKKEAIEDLKILLDKHPEMVYKVKEVAKSIEAIVNKIDTNNITEYGIKIVMDEEKILREGKYTLEEIYKNIDDLAEFSRMKKIDKFYYVSKNDSPSDLGCFVWSNLEEQDWFIENLKEWLWLDKDDGVHDIFARIIEKRRLNEKIS
ncbi:hypothetical protein [Aliarcobacter trophiarum]|uniref:hypothetical protein n=1 Tax=Aliarcobacter trophiarum TaxID=708186 RepID=UPI001E3404E0|nr:hypothetical protein [Aliarcobacter trophiarum]